MIKSIRRFVLQTISAFSKNVPTTSIALERGLTFSMNIYGDEINTIGARSVWCKDGVSYYCDELYYAEPDSFIHPTLGRLWKIIFPVNPDGGISLNIFTYEERVRCTGAKCRLLEPVYLLDGEYYLGPIEQGRNISTGRRMPFRTFVNIIAYEGIINLQ